MVNLRKCETFGCLKVAVCMVTIAPGTTVWLCLDCKKEMEKNA